MEKVYKARMGNRIVAVAVGLLFAIAGVVVVVQGKLIGLLIVLIGAGLIWVGLRPNKLIIQADGIEFRSAGVKRYSFAQMRKVRMVARRYYAGSRVTQNVGVGRTTVKMSVAGARYKMYPEIVIEGDFGYPFVLQVPYKGPYINEDGTPRDFTFTQVALFDAQAVMADILARLPSAAEVEPAVQTYAATGSLPDMLTLPVENPKLPFGSKAGQG